jgi:hypothetical protein
MRDEGGGMRDESATRTPSKLYREGRQAREGTEKPHREGRQSPKEGKSFTAKEIIIRSKAKSEHALYMGHTGWW